MNMSNFLDLYDIFVNELFGGVWIFILVAVILLFYVSLKYNIPSEVTLLLALVFLSGIFANNTSLIILWVIVVLISGLLFYYKYQRAIRSG